MKIKHHDIPETIKRLKKHPVWTMDAQNVTADAAMHLEHQQGIIDSMSAELNEMMDLIGCGYEEMHSEHYGFRFEQLRTFIQSNTESNRERK